MMRASKTLHHVSRTSAFSSSSSSDWSSTRPIATDPISRIYRCVAEKGISFDVTTCPLCSPKHFRTQIQAPSRSRCRMHMPAPKCACHLSPIKFTWHQRQAVSITHARSSTDRLVWCDRSWPLNSAHISNSATANETRRHISRGTTSATNWTLDGLTQSDWLREERNSSLPISSDPAQPLLPTMCVSDGGEKLANRKLNVKMINKCEDMGNFNCLRHVATVQMQMINVGVPLAVMAVSSQLSTGCHK